MPQALRLPHWRLVGSVHSAFLFAHFRPRVSTPGARLCTCVSCVWKQGFSAAMRSQSLLF